MSVTRDGDELKLDGRVIGTLAPRALVPHCQVELRVEVVIDLEVPFPVGGSTALCSIALPEGLTTISDEAFRNFTSLSSVIFSDRGLLTTIGEKAFFGCTAALPSYTLLSPRGSRRSERRPSTAVPPSPP